MERSLTPYENFLLESLEETRKKLDTLYNEFARANSVRKQALKGEIDAVKQNIEILTRDIEKYGLGLTWLREASKSRDLKSEHLEKVQIAEAENKPAPATPSATTSQAAPARPTVGTPIGTPRPTIGKPVGAKPVVGTPTSESDTAKKTTESSKEKKEGSS